MSLNWPARTSGSGEGSYREFSAGWSARRKRKENKRNESQINKQTSRTNTIQATSTFYSSLLYSPYMYIYTVQHYSKTVWASQCVCVSNNMSALVDGLSTTRNFVCILYTYEYIKLNVRITVNDELEMGWKEVIATYFTVILQHLSEWNWETNKNKLCSTVSFRDDIRTWDLKYEARVLTIRPLRSLS